MSNMPAWAGQSGDVWADRWRDTDRALSGLAPALLAAILAAAPSGPFTAFDVGCGPGSTTLDLAEARDDARIVACDLSPALAALAWERLEDFGAVDVVLGDAPELAVERGPFDLIYSRHGVMFFADPVAAFTALRRAASPGAGLVFSCFQSWELNPWASALGSAAAGAPIPAPGQEPGAFAFADREHVKAILEEAGWTSVAAQAVQFRYVAGTGNDAVEQALSFLTAIGPAARILDSLQPDQRGEAMKRLGEVVASYHDGDAVVFDAAAWIWTARADRTGAPDA